MKGPEWYSTMKGVTGEYNGDEPELPGEGTCVLEVPDFAFKLSDEAKGIQGVYAALEEPDTERPGYHMTAKQVCGMLEENQRLDEQAARHSRDLQRLTTYIDYLEGQNTDLTRMNARMQEKIDHG